MMHRRPLLAAAGLLALPRLARAQPRWEPTRPITLLVGFAPGGGTDIIARFLAPALQAEFGQPIAVENRPGASGTIAALAGSRAAPDGHTLYMTTVSASAVVPPLMTPPPFDIYKDQTRGGAGGHRAAGGGGAAVLPGEGPGRLHRPCQGQSGGAELLLLRRRHAAASGGGTARLGRRHQDDACAVPRHRPGGERDPGRAHRPGDRHAAHLPAAYPERRDPRLGGDLAATGGMAAQSCRRWPKAASPASTPMSGTC